LEEKASTFYVYVLQNPAGRFYIGSTSNLERRIAEHNVQEHNPKKYTSKHKGFWQLVYHKTFDNLADALRYERHIKRMKSARWIREHLLQKR